MKKSIFFFSFVFLSVFSNAQKDSTTVRRAKNSFFIEYGGNGVEHGIGGNPIGHISFNYDRLLHIGKSIKSTIRIGSNIPSASDLHVIPIMLNLLIGKKNFYFEMGGGYEFIFFEGDYKKANGAITTVLGLRYQNYKKGIMARIGITPTIGSDDGASLYLGPIAGISIGYNF